MLSLKSVLEHAGQHVDVDFLRVDVAVAVVVLGSTPGSGPP